MPVLALVAVTVGVVGVVYGISRLVGADSEPLREAPFGSGLLPNEHALSRFHVCWHTLTILFSTFDMEIGLIAPLDPDGGRRGVERSNRVVQHLGGIARRGRLPLAWGGDEMGVTRRLVRAAARRTCGARNWPTAWTGRRRPVGGER